MKSKRTIKQFLKGLDISYMDPCLCMVCGDKYGQDCNWFDKNYNHWQVFVLDDGIAITWCLTD